MSDTEDNLESTPNLEINDQVDSQPARETPNIGFRVDETIKSVELPLAQREFIWDQNNQIIDVVFSFNGNSGTLKEVFPGDYTIELSEDDKEKPAGYSPIERKITIPSSFPEGRFNLSLFHEAGHAVDFMKDEGNWSDKIDFLLGSLYSNMAEAKLFGDPTKLDEIRDQLQNILPIVGVDVVNRLYEEYDKFKGVISSIPLDEVTTLNETLEQEESKQFAIELVRRERAAWALALKGLRQLRNKGINIFDRRNNITRDMVASCLTSYQDEFGSHLPEGVKFTGKKAPLPHPNLIYLTSLSPILRHTHTIDIEISEEEVDAIMERFRREIEDDKISSSSKQ